LRCALCGKILWPWQEWANWVHKMRIDPTGIFNDSEVVHSTCGQRHFEKSKK